MIKIFYIVLLYLIWVNSAYSQEKERNNDIATDSVFIEANKEAQLTEEDYSLDPQRSAMLSAALPGLGQIYNGQYWKVPIIYGGLIAFVHFVRYNNELYHAFRNAAIAQQNRLENPFARLTAGNQSALIRNRDNFRRNRDFLIILGAVFYLLNVVDAHVTAHLSEFNINDDLTLSITIMPSMGSLPFNQTAMGASFVIKPRK